MTITTHFHRASRSDFPSGVLTTVENSLVSVSAEWIPKGAPRIRKNILGALQREGWSDRVKPVGDLKITIGSILDDTGLCVQFGNVARVYADLVKLQLAFNEAVIRRGILIVPLKVAAVKVGSNLANFERLELELKNLNDQFTIPLVIYGVHE